MRHLPETTMRNDLNTYLTLATAASLAAFLIAAFILAL